MKRAAALALASALVLAAGGGAAGRSLPPTYALPSWSPEGAQLVFARASGPASAILIARADGNRLRRLARTGVLSQLTLSPNGRSIAYASRGRLIVIRRDGTSRRVVGSGADLAWSGDGSRLAFAGSAVGGPIQVVKVDGSGRRRLTAEHLDHMPAWSPDGERLAFTRAAAAGRPDYLYVVGADGSGLRRLGPQGAAPAWSPDGRRLAFWQSNGEGVVLSVYSFADAQVRTLTRTFPAFSRAPVWSPDGTRLLLTVCGPFGACRLDVAAADGSAVTRIASGSDPAWSPTGLRIAFTTRGPCPASGIYVADPDGTRARRITPCR
jgi:Tol biopolymer transport system component